VRLLTGLAFTALACAAMLAVGSRPAVWLAALAVALGAGALGRLGTVVRGSLGAWLVVLGVGAADARLVAEIGAQWEAKAAFLGLALALLAAAGALARRTLRPRAPGSIEGAPP
jgi:hypothetical protein